MSGPRAWGPGPGAELLAVKWGVSKNTWSLIFVGRSFLTFSPVKTQAFAADATRRQEPGAARCSQARANTRVKRKGLSDDAEPSAKVQSHRRRISGRSFDSLNVVGSVGEPRAAQPNAKSRQSVAAQYVPLAPVQRQWQVENETPGLSWGLLPGSPFGPPASCPGGLWPGGACGPGVDPGPSPGLGPARAAPRAHFRPGLRGDGISPGSCLLRSEAFCLMHALNNVLYGCRSTRRAAEVEMIHAAEQLAQQLYVQTGACMSFHGDGGFRK